jgi:HEAT repeat protein
MKAGLHQFSANDPQWEETRAAWLAKGPDEADFLVRTMWAALLQFQAMNRPQEVERARHELALIGEPSVPLMAEFLAGGTIREATDPQTGERRDLVVDDFARSEAAEVLGLIGKPAAPAVRDALGKAPNKAGKRAALRTLGYIGDRGGAAAYEPLLEYAKVEDDVLRVEAVVALGYFHDETTRAALIQSLSDAEPLVRRKAAESLMNRRDASAAPAVRAAGERARAAGKIAEASEMDQSADWIEKHAK